MNPQLIPIRPLPPKMARMVVVHLDAENARMRTEIDVLADEEEAAAKCNDLAELYCLKAAFEKGPVSEVTSRELGILIRALVNGVATKGERRSCSLDEDEISDLDNDIHLLSLILAELRNTGAAFQVTLERM